MRLPTGTFDFWRQSIEHCTKRGSGLLFAKIFLPVSSLVMVVNDVVIVMEAEEVNMMRTVGVGSHTMIVVNYDILVATSGQQETVQKVEVPELK